MTTFVPAAVPVKSSARQYPPTPAPTSVSAASRRVQLQVRKIYDTLGVGNFDAVQPLLEEYLVSLGTFEKNKHSPVSDDMKHLVTSRWGQSFDEFGYDKRL